MSMIPVKTLGKLWGHPRKEENAPVSMLDRSYPALEQLDQPMLRTGFTTLANAIVEASDIAKGLAELRAEFQVLREQHMRACQAEGDALASRDRAVNELDDTKAKLTTAHNNLTDAEDKAWNAKAEIARLKDDAELLKMEIEDLKLERTKALDDRDRALFNNDELSKINNRLRDEIDELHGKLASIRTILA